MNSELTKAGNFVVGCNYWASHAGTAMWRDWNEEIVREDFKKMAAIGLQLIRVFPLWPDFQPLQLLRGDHGCEKELRLGEQPLSHDDAGRAGVDPVMIERFRIMADIAAAAGLKLSVGLVTGWMSGRLFVPPAFEGKNVLNDPLVIKWQVRFVRYFVRTFKNHPAIAAWGPGNECNCMAPVKNREDAWNWMNAICGAVRQEDATRPIISGMHSLLPAADARMSAIPWTIQDQGELSDMLTTHPYPEFTPYAKLDPINCLRNAFHATAESRMYGDIGGKPCICEEIGTLAAMLAGEKVKAAYARNVMFNLWAHDCHGFVWWCGFDQVHLEHAPYDWTAVERELGLFRQDGSPKPVAEAINNFREVLNGMPFKSLPPRRRDAVCILSEGQDAWASAWGSFILAKQAGIDFDFCFSHDALPESDLYLVPGLSSSESFSRHHWQALIDRVENHGATLYASLDDGLVVPFNQVFGVESQYREVRDAAAQIDWNGQTFAINTPYRYRLELEGADVLAAEADGNPAFIRCRRGKGTVYLLTAAMEKHLTKTPGAFHRADALPFYRFYQEIAGRERLGRRLIRPTDALVTVTEHPVSANEAVVVLVNNQPDAVETAFHSAPEWQIAATLYGKRPENRQLSFNGNDAMVLLLQRG